MGECFARDLSLLHVLGTCQAAQIEVRDGEEKPLRPPPPTTTTTTTSSADFYRLEGRHREVKELA